MELISKMPEETLGCREGKVAIFIPAYNVAKTISSVIDRIPPEVKSEIKEILIIDDGSRDNTFRVVSDYKKQKNLSELTIIRNGINRGYGATQKIAYQYAISRGMDYIVMLHSDGQYAPEMIPALLEKITGENADMVFGSRIKGDPRKGGMPKIKIIGNKALTAIENFVLDLNLSEFHSGYRIYNCKALQQIPFNLCSEDYVFDTEIIIQFKIKNLKIIELPIQTHYGKESQSPTFFALVKYTLSILKTMGEYLFQSYGIKKIKKFEIRI